MKPATNEEWRHRFRLLGFALVFLYVFVGGLALGHRQQENGIKHLERLACAFVQYEDGSVRPRTEDAARLRCLEEVGR
jgi:hypothetical protein